MCFLLLWNNPHVLIYTVKISQSGWFNKTLFGQEPGRWGAKLKILGRRREKRREAFQKKQEENVILRKGIKPNDKASIDI